MGFEALLATSFAGQVNALCWRRSLKGDFEGLMEALAAAGMPGGVYSLQQEELLELELSGGAAEAREAVLGDWRALEAAGLQPCVDWIDGYDYEAGCEQGFPTHVRSFHVDRATGPADTWLCTYAGKSSLGLVNEDARWRVADGELRTGLLKLFGGQEGAAFESWLVERFHDLHYHEKVGARVYEFGLGSLWKIACDHPLAQVDPCIHRAPDSSAGGGRRLLLIA
jgi:hypothetical protein